MERANVTVAAVGDLTINRDEPDTAFDHVREELQSADITFAQLETPYSDRGSRGSSGPRGAMPKDVRNYPAIPNAGFDVISLASNHAMDWGEDALLDLKERLIKDGIAPVGAGENLAAARQPAILERRGTKVAFLSYCSVAPSSYYAVAKRTGVAPMRAMTHYEPLEPDQPGTPCQIVTLPLKRDLDALVSDIEAARESSDVVILSMHWGIHRARAVIADYQTEVGHAAIDAGADIVVGHHPHILKGIEVYKGKVIFYSLGNFVFDSVKADKGRDDPWHEIRAQIYREFYQAPERDPNSKYRFQADSKYSMMVKLSIIGGAIDRVSFRPVIINNEATPEFVHPDEERGREVLEYLVSITRAAGLNAEFVSTDEHFIVQAAAQRTLSPIPQNDQG
jgi:poly-gamma-glutamate capsule biosynthesis protein CapA/YwtB (metallophosphatase superfamily)